MKLIRYQDITQFYNRVLPFLLKHEAEHNLLLGIIIDSVKNNIDNPLRQKLDMLCVVEDNEIIFVAINSIQYNLLLSLTDKLEAVSLLADYLYNENISGVTGTKAVVETFINSLCKNNDYHLKRHLHIYQLEKDNFVEARKIPGKYVKANEADKNLLIKWFADFYNNPGINIKYIENEVNECINESIKSHSKGIRLWCDDTGNPVSFARFSSPTINGIRIGPVYTPPEYRGQGFANACVSALSKELLEKYLLIFLFAECDNLASNHIYQKIGYQIVCDVYEYTKNNSN